MKGYRPLYRLGIYRSDCGLTKVELIGVAAVCGLLGAIALPSVFNQTACACKGEAPTYVGSLARAQQAFFLENGKFSGALAPLEAGIERETENYAYRIAAEEGWAIAYATSKQDELESYVSAVFLLSAEAEQSPSFALITCRAQQPGSAPIAQPLNSETCGLGTEPYQQFESQQIEIEGR